MSIDRKADRVLTDGKDCLLVAAADVNSNDRGQYNGLQYNGLLVELQSYSKACLHFDEELPEEEFRCFCDCLNRGDKVRTEMKTFLWRGTSSSPMY